MGQRVIKLGSDAELIIEEPNIVSSTDRALIVTSAIIQEFSSVTALGPVTRSSSLPIKIGSTMYSIYYQIRVKRLMSALAAYSETIAHIKSNPHLYDQRLANKAIEVLRECYRNEMK